MIGARKQINSELWHACAGPLVILPQVGSLVCYFPQGHSEQVCFLTTLLHSVQDSSAVGCNEKIELCLLYEIHCKKIFVSNCAFPRG